MQQSKDWFKKPLLTSEVVLSIKYIRIIKFWNNDNKNSAPVCANGKAYTVLKVTEQRRNAMLMERVCLASSEIFLYMRHKFLGAYIFWHVTQTWHVGMLRGHNVTQAPAGERDLDVHVAQQPCCFHSVRATINNKLKSPRHFLLWANNRVWPFNRRT